MSKPELPYGYKQCDCCEHLYPIPHMYCHYMPINNFIYRCLTCYDQVLQATVFHFYIPAIRRKPNAT